MLDSIRKKKDNLIYTFLILAVVAVMALYGVGKMAGDQNAGGAVAWVNGEIITRDVYRQELEMKMNQYQQMMGGQYDEKFLMTLQIPQRTVDELIQQKLLTQQAKKLEFLVPDKELIDNIKSEPYYQKDGKFDAELYSGLPNRGMEEKRRRERLQLVKFYTYLVNRIQLTPTALKDAYQAKETKVDVEYAKIDFNALAPKIPAPGEVDAYLKTAKATDFQQYYDSHHSEFTEKAMVNLRQIKVNVPFQAKAPQKDEAKKKMDEIAKLVTLQNFTEVASKRSEDESSKKGGNLGWVARGSLEPALENALDKLPTNQVSAPVETPFGYYLLLVTEKKDEKVKPLDSVKRDIAVKLVGETSKKAFIDGKRKEWEKILASGKSIEPELKKLKVDVKKTGPFSLGQGHVPSIGPADPILDAIYQLTPDAPIAKHLVPYLESEYYLKLKTVDRPKMTELAKDADTVETDLLSPVRNDLLTEWLSNLKKTAAIKMVIEFNQKQETAID